MTSQLTGRKRWLALYLLCAGALMVVIDTTVVTVALPSIQADLQFTGTSLVWVLNAYMLTFGGFLLLGGRLGDLYGARRLFLIGLAGFTLASLACGLAPDQGTLIVARAVQGIAGAVVTAVALSLMMNLFAEPGDRAKAMGIYGFVCAAGGSIGEVLGGFLTNAFGWELIFLINLPIGIAVYMWILQLLPRDAAATGPRRLDLAGAFTVTTGLMLAVYAVVDGNAAGWGSLQTQGLLAAALALLGLFLFIESRVAEPLMPLRLFTLRNVSVANVGGVLWAAGMFAWFVISALYLQHVLGYDPFKVGLSFLPADVIMAAFSAGLSARMVMRFGIRGPLWLGLLIAALGLALFARAPLGGTFVVDVLPGMLLLGLGAGMAFNPILLAAMNDVREDESGLASGVVNTSFMMGGALGLAVLASVADARTAALKEAGVAALAALNGGFQLAFLAGALITALGALVCGVLLRPRPQVQREPLDSDVARELIGALNAELSAQYPEPGSTHFRLDPGEVAEGRGAFLVARLEGRPIGCGAIRKLDADSAEIKRMYVVPNRRGAGHSKLILAALEAEARALGVHRLVLETGDRQVQAVKLYENAGFVRIPPFGEYVHSPLSVCMAKALPPPPAEQFGDRPLIPNES